MFKRDRVGLVSAIVAVAATIVSAQLPAHSHRDFSFGDKADLPRDGWMVYFGKSPSGVSGTQACRIKGTFSPVLLKKNGNPFEYKRATFSADGKWLVGAVSASSGYTVHMVKIVGTPDQWQVFDLGIASTEFARFYYNSPYEDPAAGEWEVSWITPDKNKAMARIVDVSSGTPRLGAERTVANIGKGKWDEFMISGDVFLYDDNPTYCATIPDLGRGTAGPDDIVRWTDGSVADRNCATVLSPSTKYWAGNPGGTSLRSKFGDNPNGPVPVNHDGFFLCAVRRISDPPVTIKNWYLDPAAGAVSLNFVPEEICIDANCYFQRNTGGQDNKWFGWYFLNDERYVAGFHFATATQPNFGGYIVRWADNKWYEVVPPTVDAPGIVAWFDDVAVEEWEGRPTPVHLSIVSPAPSARVEVNKPVRIEATASSDDGTVSKVEFSLGDGTALKTFTAAPYAMDWTPTAEGEYVVQIVGTDSKGNVGKTRIRITVLAQIVLKSIQVVPAKLYAVPGKAYQLEAVGIDQYGSPLTNQPVFTWSVSGGGTVDGNGLFVAGTQGGEFAATATAGAVSGKNTIVLQSGIMVNFQATGTPPAGWLIDKGEVHGDRGNGYTYGWDKACTGSMRNRTEGNDFLTKTLAQMFFDNTAYTWELAVPNGPYRVTVAAGDKPYPLGYWKINAENVTVVEGTPSATNWLFIDSALVSVSDGKLTLSNAPEAQYNKLCYVIVAPVMDSPAEGFRILSPQAGTSYSIGDTVAITWIAAEAISTCVPSISLDDGRSWTELFGSSVDRGGPDWGQVKWAVPAQVMVGNEPTSLVNATVKFRLSEYDAGGGSPQVTMLDGTISIAGDTRLTVAAGRALPAALSMRSTGTTLVITPAAGSGAWRGRVVSAQGRTVRHLAGGASVSRIDLSILAAGTYAVEAWGHTGAVARCRVVRCGSTPKSR